MEGIISRGCWLEEMMELRQGVVTSSNQFLGSLRDICRTRVRQMFSVRQIEEMEGDIPSTLIKYLK